MPKKATNAKKSGQDEPLREAKVVKTPDEEFENDSDLEFIGDDTMLMPNEGENLAPNEQELDEEAQEEVNQDKAMFEGNPLVDAVFDWLDNEIADCDSIEAAHGIADAYKVDIGHAMTALDVCRKVFIAKRVSFQNIHDTVNPESN